MIVILSFTYLVKLTQAMLSNKHHEPIDQGIAGRQLSIKDAGESRDVVAVGSLRH